MFTFGSLFFIAFSSSVFIFLLYISILIISLLNSLYNFLIVFENSLTISIDKKKYVPLTVFYGYGGGGGLFPI